MKHVFEKCECNEPGCVICDGGLAICKICGLAEGCLTTDCPGKESWNEYGDEVYAGSIDFKNGEWAKEVSPHCPKYSFLRQQQIQEEENNTQE